MKTILKVSLITVVLGIAAPALANPIANFQLNGVYMMSSGNNQLTGEVAWTPHVDLGPLGVRFEFGAFFPRNAVDDRYVALDTEVFGRLNLAAGLTLEAGGGA